jgi:hypothetical protein
LRTAQLPGLFASPACPIQQATVCLAQQAHTDGQPFGVAQLLLRPTESTQVVGHFFDIVAIADLETCFFVEQVGQRGLCTLDL